MVFLRKTLPFLLLAFALSIAVRLPQLNRPLSKHHEFCTAISLRILEIWYDNGIENFNGNPVMTYQNDADKFINNHANASGKMLDRNGNYYYVSHPPMAYYFAFGVFKLLHWRPSVLGIQLINLFLHFISALFVYFTVSVLSFNRARSYLYFPAFVSYVIYLFLPPTLWFQGNVYMSDMAVQVPFIVGTYIVLKMIIRQKFYVPKYIVFYILNLFLLLYTSWLGVFYAVGVIVYSLMHLRSNKGFRVLLISTVVTLFVVLQLISYQYSLINGPEAYLSEILNRYLLRGSVGIRHQGFFYFFFSYFIYLKNLLYNYLVNYLPFYAMIAGFIYIGVTRAKLKIVFSENGYRFIWLSVMPILFLHLVFLNYSSQDFTVLYASLFFSVLFGIFYDKMKKSGVFSARKLNLAVVVTVLIFIAQYELMNLPGEYSIHHHRYADEKEWGEAVKAQSDPNDIIFSTTEPSPQMVYYAGRNIRWVHDAAEAFTFESHRHYENAVLFEGFPKEKMTRRELILKN
ncbi:MAG: hypothetical protein U0T73_02115 [Chitinophagales bacterium]